MQIDIPKTAALGNWYGSDRMVAATIARQLDDCAWVGIGCGGGMSIIPYLNARSILVADLHRHIINLARCVREPRLRIELFRYLKRTPLHPDELAAAQERCRNREACFGDSDELFASGFKDTRFEGPDVEWACDFFVCQWMGRGGRGGTASEFDGGFSFRRNANGGGSAVRFHSAVRSLTAWGRNFRRCDFVVEDVFEFIKKIGDRPDDRLGLYLDPPWVDDGADYKHPFTDRQHRQLADACRRFESTRVVIRYGDHPLIRELYAGERWKITELDTRNQANAIKTELMIVNAPASAA